MKRLLMLLVAPMALILTACHKDNPEIPSAEKHYGRTVLMYMAMQNSLGSSKYHMADSAEIANAMGYIPADDRMLLFIDDKDKPRIYELSRELAEKDPKTGMPYGPKLVKQWRTDVSSASAATVTEVLEFMRTTYASDSYGLIMGSHATGWVPAELGANNRAAAQPEGGRAPRKTFGIDVGPDGVMANDHGVGGTVADQIEIGDLAAAIRKSGVKPEFILFDACLMQNIEVDYALRNATNYVIASPISISAEGGYYTDLVHYGLFTEDVADVARTYTSYYEGNGTIPYTDGYGTVMSCVRTGAMDNVAACLRDMLYEIAQRHPDAVHTSTGALDLVATLKKANMEGALNYQAYCKGNYYRPHNYDIVSAMRHLGADAMQMRRLQQVLSEAVTYQGATKSFWIGPGYWTMQTMPKSTDEWCGVSMFVPQELYTANADVCLFGDLNDAFCLTEWGQMLLK